MYKIERFMVYYLLFLKVFIYQINHFPWRRVIGQRANGLMHNDSLGVQCRGFMKILDWLPAESFPSKSIRTSYHESLAVLMNNAAYSPRPIGFDMRFRPHFIF